MLCSKSSFGVSKFHKNTYKRKKEEINKHLDIEGVVGLSNSNFHHFCKLQKTTKTY